MKSLKDVLPKLRAMNAFNLPSVPEKLRPGNPLRSFKNINLSSLRTVFNRKNKISDAAIAAPDPSTANQTEQEREYVMKQIRAWKRQPKWYDPWLDCLIEFCQITGLHAADNIPNKALPKYDRIAWFVLIITALGISSLLLFISWTWSTETPTKQQIESLHAAVYLVPFPAVTICSGNHISLAKATELSNTFKYTNYTPNDFLKVIKLSMGFKGGLNVPNEQYLVFDQILKSNNYDIEKLNQFLAPRCENLVTKCMWKSEARKCESIFQTITTAFGKCCSFNFFATNKTTFPRRAVLRNEVPLVPQRVTSPGILGGLTVLIEPKIADFFATHFSTQGPRVILHDSYNFPDENSINSFVPVRSEAHIQLNARQTYATNDLRDITPEARNCLFYDEKKLKNFKRYSLANCYAECRSELIAQQCGCIPTTLPKNDTYKTCQAADIPCILKNRERYIASGLPGVNFNTKPNETQPDLNAYPCDCLPDCEINEYSSISYAAFLNRNFSYSFPSIFKGVELNDQILLHIYFSDIVITRYKITPFQTWLEILASFGGLLGFVNGLSIVTIGEFVFLTFFSPILNHFKI